MNQPSALNKVVLLIPNTRWHGKRPWLLLPHSATILTRILKPHFNFHILDANAADLDESAVRERLRQLQPHVVLVSGVSVEYFSQYHQSFALAREAVPECVIVFGGIYATVMPEESMEDQNLDWVYIGPAEDRSVTFIKCLLDGRRHEAEKIQGIGFRNAQGQVVINHGFSFPSETLNPDYSLIDVAAYLPEKSKDYNYNFPGPTAVLLTSYGCRYNCSFCASHSIRGKGTTFRPAADVLEEIEWFITHFNVRHLSFLDECFFDDRERVTTILNAFIERNYGLTWKMPNVSVWHLDDELLELMQRSGCQMITVSVESGSERVLSQVIHKPVKLRMFPPIIKKCRELNILVAANFVIGSPGETWQEIRQTFQVAEDMEFDLCSFHIATPYPKTELYALARAQNLLPLDFDFRDPKYYGTSCGFITTDEFTPFELMVLRAFEWDRINFKTPEKTARIAAMMNMTVVELNEHRRQTRKKCGVHY